MKMNEDNTVSLVWLAIDAKLTITGAMASE